MLRLNFFLLLLVMLLLLLHAVPFFASIIWVVMFNVCVSVCDHSSSNCIFAESVRVPEAGKHRK